MDKIVKVTVGIPFYNAEKYLAFAIQSIINQTFSEWELILADDGSTDNSLRIACSFPDPRIRILHDGAHMGISFRLNQIITEARGTYLARMDADDICFPNRIEIQFLFMENNPDKDIADTEIIVIDEKNQIIGYRAVKKDFISNDEAFKSARFIHPTVMFRKDYVEKMRYNSQFDGAEDLDLWIRSFNTARVEKINQPLLFYRDPLRINRKSYLHRCRIQLSLLKNHRHKVKDSVYRIYKIRIWMKMIITSLASFLNLDACVLKRRNKPLLKTEIDKFSLTLKQAIMS